jgi:hypothetical protein
MADNRSIWAKLLDLTAIALVVGLVVGVSTWVVDARQQHAAPQSASAEHSAARRSTSQPS